MSMTAEFAADAREYLTNERARRAEYMADVDAWYRSGDGRSTRDGGRGYAYPYCIHGASLWVDHDIPCGYCEAGESEGGIYAEALAYARRRARERQAKVSVAVEAIGALGALVGHLTTLGVDRDIRDLINQTTMEAISAAYTA